MPMTTQKITPCLWFDSQAEEAANAYISIFNNSRIARVSRYGREGHEIHGKRAGSVMAVEFEIEWQKFVALNGGPQFKFNEAVSFQVHCETQEEVDYFWNRLTEEGEEGSCGWLKDKYGVSWQIVPAALPKMLMDPDQERSKRVYQSISPNEKVGYWAIRTGVQGMWLMTRAQGAA